MNNTVDLDDLKTIKSPTITAEVASKYLGCSPQWIRRMARERPERLNFQVCCPTPHTVKISRLSFMRFLGMEVDA